MWDNFFLDLCYCLVTSIEFIGGIFGIVLIYWCYRGNIKVTFSDEEDDDD